MTFPVVGSNIPSVYQISNSLRFNDNDSAYLTKTFSSAGNRKTWTFSCWVKLGNLSAIRNIFSGTNVNQIRFNSDNSFFVYINDSTVLQTNALYRDTASWYHIIIACDTTQSTASNRTKLYVNGTQITSFATENQLAQNTDTGFNNTTAHTIGRQSGGGFYYDGYMAEVHFIDGQQLSPTDFGEFDLDSGIWKPKQYAGTYGTNGFYLKFNNTGNMGEDSSGNDNTWTPTNLSGTTDVTTDTPTNNFATLNPLSNNEVPNNNTFIYAEGNNEFTGSGSDTSLMMTVGNQGFNTGKWYWEIKCLVEGGNFPNVSIVNSDYNISGIQNNYAWLSPYGYSYLSGGSKNNNGGGASYGDSWTTGDIIGVAVDYDNGYIYFSKNGTWQNSGVPTSGASGTGSAYSINQSQTYLPAIGLRADGTAGKMSANFGNPSFSISSGNTDDNGYGNFEYAPPSGYLALCTQNLATALSPTIDDGSQYFNTVLYTGTGSSQAITGVGFQPDFTWIKIRNTADAHGLVDSTRGATKHLRSDSTASEFTRATDVSSFDSDGFTVVSDAQFNGSGNTYASWNWKANGGTTSSNTDGSITSTVQANTTAGFSVVTYTGTGSSSTAGHGLNSTPEIIISKARNATQDWAVHTTIIDGSMDFLVLNNTNAKSDSSFSLPTSTVFPTRTSNDYVAYIFHSVEGYSKFGSYTGNGSTDGTFVYTGFRPAWVMIKVTDTTEDWWILDTTRDTFNSARRMLYADGSSAEINVSEEIDFLSNGFKLRRSTTGRNGSGNSYIYLAFAENPFVTSGAVPVTAR